jgi:hypothetical protein
MPPQLILTLAAGAGDAGGSGGSTPPVPCEPDASSFPGAAVQQVHCISHSRHQKFEVIDASGGISNPCGAT